MLKFSRLSSFGYMVWEKDNTASGSSWGRGLSMTLLTLVGLVV